jgi:hypothetical protein
VNVHNVNEPPFGAPTPFSKKHPPPKDSPIEVTFCTAVYPGTARTADRIV